MLDALPEACIAFDRGWRITWLNRAAERHFGQDLAALVGRVTWEAFPAKVGTALERSLRDAAASPVQVDFEAWSPLRRTWMSYRAHPTPDGLTVFFSPARARRRNESSLDFLADAAAVLGASLDYAETLRTLTRVLVPARADFCIVDVFEQGELRRVATAHRDPTAETLLAQTGSLGPSATMRRVFENGEVYFARDVPRDWKLPPDADPRYLEALELIHPRSGIAVPLTSRGRSVGVMTLANVTEARLFDELDLSLAQRLAELAGLAIDNARAHRDALEARRARDATLGFVSHDLRSPLNAIALNVRVLARRCPEQGAPLEDIRRSVDHADRLIQDLLLAARLEEGALPIARRAVTVGVLLDDVAALCAGPAAERDVELVFAADRDLSACVDDHRVVQLLVNLVTNALKFSPAGTAVTVGAARDGDALVLRVSDQGPGVAESDLPHLFDRYWQGARARRAGAGLGLAIVKGIAEAHGGGVTVESRLGHGTSFHVRLPDPPADPQPPPSP